MASGPATLHYPAFTDGHCREPMPCFSFFHDWGERQRQKRNKNRLRQWVSILAIPVFLAGTALFSFLWNVPMDKLAAPRAADAPVAVLLESLARPPCGPYPKIPPFIRQFFPDQKLCGNCHQCRAPRLLQPCPARGGNTDGRAFHRPEPFPGRFQLPNQIRIQHADKQKTGRLRPGYLPVDEKQDEGGKREK